LRCDERIAGDFVRVFDALFMMRALTKITQIGAIKSRQDCDDDARCRIGQSEILAFFDGEERGRLHIESIAFATTLTGATPE